MHSIVSLSPCTGASDWTTVQVDHQSCFRFHSESFCVNLRVHESMATAIRLTTDVGKGTTCQALGSTWSPRSVAEHFRSGVQTPASWLVFFFFFTRMTFCRMRPELTAKLPSSRPDRRAPPAAVSNSQIGIMLSSSGSKYIILSAYLSVCYYPV